MKIMKLSGDRMCNLDYVAWSEPVEGRPGSLRVFIAGAMVREIDDGDADKFRRRVDLIDKAAEAPECPPPPVQVERVEPELATAREGQRAG